MASPRLNHVARANYQVRYGYPEPAKVEAAEYLLPAFGRLTTRKVDRQYVPSGSFSLTLEERIEEVLI